MKLPRILTTTAVVVALAFAGCGDDEETSTQSGAGPTETQPQQRGQTPSTEVAPAETSPGGGEDAVKDAIVQWTFEGDCEVMTDKFLEQQSFIGDNREERCKYFQDAYQKPQYSEDDIEFRSVQVSGHTATVVIGSAGINVESEYKLVNEGGAWKIDEAGLK